MAASRSGSSVPEIEGPVMIEPFAATVMFSTPTTMVCDFAVSAAEALSRLLQAMMATIAKKPMRTAARFLRVV